MSAFKVEKGELKIDLSSFVDMLGPDEQKEIARQLCADEHLFKAVLECVADTSENGFGHYFTDDEDGYWWFSPRTVLEMREKLLPMMPEIARLAMEEALRQRDAAVEEKERMSRWAWQMYHHWPAGKRNLPMAPAYGKTYDNDDVLPATLGKMRLVIDAARDVADAHNTPCVAHPPCGNCKRCCLRIAMAAFDEPGDVK